MPDVKYSFKGDAGRLMFPPSTSVMDLKTSAPKLTDPVGAMILSVGDQLAKKPDVSAASTRTSKVSAHSLADLVALAESDGAIKRPNGEYYWPRSIKAGDVTLQDVAMVQRAYEQRIPVLLFGPPGTGKTALAEGALENLVTLSGHGDTEFGDFEGSYVQNPDGTFTWVDGPWVIAMENGWPMLVDEIALIDSRVMAGIYPSMDGRKEVHCRANPARGKINIKDGFMIIGACNPDVPGAVMSEALMSRFLLHIEVFTDFNLAEKLGVPKEIVVVAKNLARKAKTEDIMRAPQMRELLGFKKIAETFGLHPALANFIGLAEPGDRDAYREAVSSAFGKKIEHLTIG